MQKVEVHTKTKYSSDYDSVIDVETIIFNAYENKERGIIFIDKDSIYSFPKIESSYNKLINENKNYKNFNIGYGVELTTIIDNNKYQITLIVQKQIGLNNLYKIINNYNNTIDINYILNNKEGLLLGLIYNKNIKDLSIFDYIEINSNINVNHDLVVYSNQVNSMFEGEQLALDILSVYRHKNKSNIRLYKDTIDTLKDFNNKEILINNSNKLLDMIDNINIINTNLYIEDNNFDEFKSLVLNKFNKLYKNPSNKLINRLNKELDLIKQLNYTYYFNLLLQITNYIKDNNESYLIDGYTNNSLISYILGITKIEPYNLPYELFYSNNLNINIITDPTFYYKKLYKYLMNNNLIKCRYGFKINKDNVFRVIKHYEIITHHHLDLDTKDYLSDLLIDIPIFNDIYSNTYFILPNNYLIPFNKEGTIYDYHDIEHNLIKIKVLPTEYIKYNSDIKICNNKYIYHLFRSIKDDIIYFNDLKYKIDNTPKLYFDDLINILASKNNYLIEDNIYNYLKELNIEDIKIFNIINKLKENKKVIPKANIINKSYLAYSYIQNKYIKE